MTTIDCSWSVPIQPIPAIVVPILNLNLILIRFVSFAWQKTTESIPTASQIEERNNNTNMGGCFNFDILLLC